MEQSIVSVLHYQLTIESKPKILITPSGKLDDVGAAKSQCLVLWHRFGMGELWVVVSDRLLDISCAECAPPARIIDLRTDSLKKIQD